MYTQKIVLEPSSNTHVLETNKVEVQKLENGIIKLQIIGDGIVTHGEHGTIKIESEYCIKYIQQELNPIDNAITNTYD